MIQMVGRGLRTVNPEDYPGVVKTDCVILDFGTSSLIHGSLEQDIDLKGSAQDGDAPTKTCPQCEAVVPSAITECPLCGHIWETTRERQGAGELGHFVMTEIDILARSSFQWADVNGDGATLVATAGATLGATAGATRGDASGAAAAPGHFDAVFSSSSFALGGPTSTNFNPKTTAGSQAQPLP
jgi:hypothetical protein